MVDFTYPSARLDVNHYFPDIEIPIETLVGEWTSSKAERDGYMERIKFNDVTSNASVPGLLMKWKAPARVLTRDPASWTMFENYGWHVQPHVFKVVDLTERADGGYSKHGVLRFWLHETDPRGRRHYEPVANQWLQESVWMTYDASICSDTKWCIDVDYNIRHVAQKNHKQDRVRLGGENEYGQVDFNQESEGQMFVMVPTRIGRIWKNTANKQGQNPAKQMPEGLDAQVLMKELLRTPQEFSRTVRATFALSDGA